MGVITLRPKMIKGKSYSIYSVKLEILIFLKYIITIFVYVATDMFLIYILNRFSTIGGIWFFAFQGLFD